MSNSFHHCPGSEVATMSFARWTGRAKGVDILIISTSKYSSFSFNFFTPHITDCFFLRSRLILFSPVALTH